ncbi:MAG: hypothetical protein ACREN5_08710 [Gemmatimonadales bacterium]
MADANYDWLMSAKRDGAAPLAIEGRDPTIEVEMWQHYSARLVAELDQVDRVLRQAAQSVSASPLRH